MQWQAQWLLAYHDFAAHRRGSIAGIYSLQCRESVKPWVWSLLAVIKNGISFLYPRRALVRDMASHQVTLQWIRGLVFRFAIPHAGIVLQSRREGQHVMSAVRSHRIWLGPLILAVLAACEGAESQLVQISSGAPMAATFATVAQRPIQLPSPTSSEPDLPAANGTPAEDTSGPPERLSSLDITIEPHVGDLKEILQRRQVRMLVSMDRTHFYFDGGRATGITADAIHQFELWLNETIHQPKHLKIQAVIVPVRRDQLIPALLEGRGDVIASFMTVTDEREQLVVFPAGGSRVNEVLVLPRGVPEPAGLEQLAGSEVHVRRSSSYYDSLVALNARLATEGLAPIRIVALDENLDTDEALELLNAGLIPATVADGYIARLWQGVLPEIQVIEALPLRTGGRLAWAVRPDNPELAQRVAEFQKEHGKGTLWGNMKAREYFGTGDFIRNPEREADRARLAEISRFFQEYGSRYSMDWLLVAAQAYQESGLDHDARSHVGAIGIMQVMPQTARDPRVGIPDIQKLDRNIEAGTKYLRFVMDHYYANEPMSTLDKGLFALASYNAGPARVTKLRAEAAKIGLDPNVWFHNVEVVAARRIGAETVTYVRNIYKYYLTYKLLEERARIQTPKS